MSSEADYHRDSLDEIYHHDQSNHLDDVEMASNSLVSEPTMKFGSMANPSEFGNVLGETISQNVKNAREEFNTNTSRLGTPSFLHRTSLSRTSSPYPRSSSIIPPSQPNPTTPTETHPRRRKRKPKTKEIQPEDHHATDSSMINLGMSPFMAGQDAMSNQNRLVRNEAILARHVSRILRLQTDAESTNAGRVQDVYRVIGNQKTDIESLQASVDSLRLAQRGHAVGHVSQGPEQMEMQNGVGQLEAGAYLSDMEIMELRKEQEQTRMILDQLNNDVTRFSTSTRRMIDDLAEVIQRLSTQHSPSGSRDPSNPSTSPNPPVTGGRFTSNFIMNRTLPPLSTLNLKRSGSDSITVLGSSHGSRAPDRTPTRSISSLTDDGTTQATRGPNHTHINSLRDNPLNVNQLLTNNNLSSREVLYGPLKQETGLGSMSMVAGSSSNVRHIPDMDATVDEAVRNVGLNLTVIQSVRTAHGRPNHVVICFQRVEHAQRFVDLVGLGLDKHPGCQAVLLVDTSRTVRGSGNES